MRDWQKLKEWAESYRNCPADFQMGAEVVRLVMEDLLALMAENEALVNNALMSAGVLRESVEYLESNQLNQIGSGSKLHCFMRNALEYADRTLAKDGGNV